MPRGRPTSALRVRLDAAVIRARARRREAEALRAEAEQAVRQARTLRQQENVLLETAASIVATIMAGRGFALAQPVSARFQTDTHGSTGIELMVKLADAREVAAATAAIHQHFGADVGNVDHVRVE